MTATVKTFHADRKFGFVTTEDGEDHFVSADVVDGGSLTPGDQVELTFGGDEDDQKVVGVTVTKAAPPSNPQGRTMMAPPTWDTLEERERQRRMARRRRR